MFLDTGTLRLDERTKRSLTLNFGATTLAFIRPYTDGPPH